MRRTYRSFYEKIERYDGFVIIMFTGIFAHLLFSRFGFNPTDEGFVLAYSRRILSGEIPHLDFISIRPVLSPLIHLPELLFAPEYTLLLSRFVFWLELSVTSWVGVDLILGDRPVTKCEKYFAFLLAFVFCAHSFPAMAWHSVDGLFLSIIGVSLTVKKKLFWVAVGYFCVGLAALCKQNFAIVAPFALLLNGHLSKLLLLFVSILPSAIYMLFYIFHDGLRDVLQQISAQSGLVAHGIEPFATISVFVSLGGGFLVARLDRIKLGHVTKTFCRELPATVFLAWSLFELNRNNIPSFSFILFGVYVGIVCERGLLNQKMNDTTGLKNGIFILLISWAVSISIGYNSPALASGLLLVSIMLRREFHGSYGVPVALGNQFFIVPLLTALAATTFFHQRRAFIYRDRQAENLTFEISHLLPGSKGIVTNKNCHDFLNELRKQFDRWTKAGANVYILPGIPAFWVVNSRRNKFPIDWAQGTEVSTKALRIQMDEFLNGVESESVIFLVPTIEVSTLAQEMKSIELDSDYNFLLRNLAHRNRKIERTLFFDVYGSKNNLTLFKVE